MVMEYLILNRLDTILRQIRKLTKKVNRMSETIVELTSRVAELETVGDSAIELLNGLKAQLDADHPILHHQRRRRPPPPLPLELATPPSRPMI